MRIDDVLAAIADGIARSLDNLDLAPYDYRPSSPPVTNSASVSLAPFNYDLDFDGSADVALVVRLIIPTSAEESASALLRSWLAPSGEASVKEAIEADPSLGGVVSSTWVRAVSNVGPLLFTDGRVCIAAELQVSVLL